MFNWCALFFTAALAASVTPHHAYAEPGGLTAPEFPSEHAALVDATRAFFDAVEVEKTEQKKAPVIGWAVNATRASAAQNDVAVLTKMGPVKHLTGYQITWYPTDTLLGTVDFMGTWDGNRNLVCGYVTWDLSTPNAPTIQSISANFISPQALSQSDTRDVHRALISSNCAHGDIDANFAFFGVDASG